MNAVHPFICLFINQQLINLGLKYDINISTSKIRSYRFWCSVNAFFNLSVTSFRFLVSSCESALVDVHGTFASLIQKGIIELLFSSFSVHQIQIIWYLLNLFFMSSKKSSQNKGSSISANLIPKIIQQTLAFIPVTAKKVLFS